MFQEGNYDVLEFSVPQGGMNQNIDPNSMPQSFAYLLENLIANPLGSARVRNGTKSVNSLGNPEANIINSFPFIKPNGGGQVILYAQEYTTDITAAAFAIVSSSQFTFTSNTPGVYIVDSPIKIGYTLNGVKTLYSSQKIVNIAGNNVTITLDSNFFPSEILSVTINSVAYSTGNIYSYDIETNALNLRKQSLSVACIPRATPFEGSLFICNGVDRNMTWDGNAITDVVDYVKEQANTFTRIDATRFSFVVGAAFDITKYQNNNLIDLYVSGVISHLTVNAVARVLNTVTITTAENLPVFNNVNIVELFYRDFPPPFSFVFAFNDRLWALGTGAAGINYRSVDQALRVYYSYEPNTLVNWFNENTKTVPSISIDDKHGISDNLEAICQVSGHLVFIGRHKTQVWSGRTPGLNGDFQWQSTLSVGIAHGDLLIELDNDTFFISPTGLKSFSTLNVAKQFSASSYDAVDPLIREHLLSISSSNLNYRACRSFKYKEGALAGFKIGKNKVLTSLFSTSLYSWSLFSGDFSNSNCFTCGVGNTLYICMRNNLFKYADGSDGDAKGYGDNNGNSPIPFVWITPIIHFNGKRFANKRYEIQMAYPSSFLINSINQLSISITGDLPKSFNITQKCNFEPRGDKFGAVPFATSENKNSPGFRFDIPYSYTKNRLKFVASRFSISLVGYAIDGELSIKRVRLFGIGEKNA